MKKSSSPKCILIDWSKMKKLSRSFLNGGYGLLNEINRINNDLYGPDAGTNATFSIFAMSKYLRTDIPIHFVLDAKKEYDKLLKDSGLTPEQFEDKYSKITKMIRLVCNTLKYQHPEIPVDMSNIPLPKYKRQQQEQQEIDISQYELEGSGRLNEYGTKWNPKATDLFEYVYEIPKNEQTSDIIAAIIDAARPIDPKASQKEIEDEILVHCRWHKYLMDHFTGGKLRFRISMNEVQVLEREIKPTKHI